MAGAFEKTEDFKNYEILVPGTSNCSPESLGAAVQYPNTFSGQTKIGIFQYYYWHSTLVKYNY